MATNNAKDNVKKYEYFNRFGIAQGIKQLAIDHPFRPHGVVAMPTPKPATQPVHAS
jgi:type IV secretion system protein VirB4